MSANRQTAGPIDVAESSYRMLVEQVRDYAIFLIDPAGWIRSWNEGAQRVFGHTRDEFTGLHTSALFVPEDIAAGIPARELETARAEGEANDDRWLMRKDGNRFWANGATTALRDADGSVIGFAKIVHDRTDQKRTEEALRESQQRLTAALHAAQMGTWRWDIASDVYTFDQSLHALFGLSPDDRIRSFADFLEHLHPEDRSTVVVAFQRSVNEGVDFNVEFRVPLPDGGLRWLRDQGQVVRDADGQVESLTGACVDITERRRTEERVRHAQRMEAVGQLAGGVAHEINNMMQGVLGFSELLLHGLPTGDERRSDVEQIRRAAGRAAMVTGQLLAFSRRQVLRAEVLELGAVIENIEPMLRRLLGEDRQLVVSRASGIGRVKADQGQVEQVLINLALNARDAMPSGGRLTLALRNVDLDLAYGDRHPGVEIRPGPYVMIAATDTGHGMDAATQARIFEPFFTTKPTGQGTGLGLATVYGIIRQSGGYIWVYSEPGRGTTFKVYLPLLVDPPAATLDRLLPAGTLPTLLVVEDEEMVRRWVVRVLSREGYECIEARNGIEALRLLEQRSGRVDLLVSDVVMPEMGGRALAERVAELGYQVPVLFMSGYTDDEVLRRGLLAPGARMIEKPMQVEVLLQAVRELIPAERRGR
ncbi:MAG: PAS domain S-box protein [Bacillota bacterium]|jgi:PAS domain S-box-containing protein